MIRIKNLFKTYPPHQEAIRGISLRVKKGDFLFIAGASGAGKSTLLKLMLGQEKLTQGEMVINNVNMKNFTPKDLITLRRYTGIVFQDYKLLLNKNIIDNVCYSLEIKGYPKKERHEMALKILKSLKLEDRAYDMPLTLSGGEQQRIAVARALIHKPSLILADEPTGNLDTQMTSVVFDLLLEANAAGVTVVVATHNLSIIEELNLRTIVLDHGKIIGDYDNPRGSE
ncbi:MAG: cell division ATP-binding protein FtsE [Bdellovibrionota bacterium]